MNSNLTFKTQSLDWDSINKNLLEKGFAVTKPFHNENECSNLCRLFEEETLYRSTIDMKRYNFGKGTYRYFKYPLPEMIQILHEEIYEKIVISAKLWAINSQTDIEYPKRFSDFVMQMRKNGQTRSTPIFLKYERGDYCFLHQDISDGIFFPYQVIFGLSQHDQDYQGCQLILTQQRPRLQTIPYIITIPKGGAVILTSNYHPHPGSLGFYRTVFKH